MDNQQQGVIPLHVAIIMDGNGRWATQRKKNRVFGHRQGAEAVTKVVAHAAKQGVRTLTLYSFSSENWKRPEVEVSELMSLLRFYLKSKIAEIHGQNIRFRVVGELDLLDDDILKLIEEGECLTANNDGMTLVLALSYGGRLEIVQAATQIAKAVEEGKFKSSDINEKLFARYLYTHDLPDPDLMIRTSGEYRTSNFLPFQLAYSELYFTETLWPDFDEAALDKAFAEYTKRHRRYGGLDDDVNNRHQAS